MGKMLLIILFCGMQLLALAVKWPLASQPPQSYWTVRQYSSILQAREIYRTDLARSGTNNEVAPRGKSYLPEFPAREFIAAKIYRIIGGEAYWPLVVQSWLAWMVAAWFIYLLSLRWLNPNTALFTSALFSLHPYSYLASSSIQPDIWLVALLVVSLWSIQRYYETPTTSRLFSSMLLSSAAVFLKPGVTQFSICIAYGLVVWNQQRLKAFTNWKNYLWATTLLLPSALYLLAHSGETSSGILVFNVRPHYLLHAFFWRGWIMNLVILYGVLGLTIAFAGLGLLASQASRAFVLWGYALGYCIQCVFTTWTTVAHDYWHLQALPLLAIGVGALSQLFYDRIRTSHLGAVYSCALAGFMLILMAYEGYKSIRELPDSSWYVEACQKIGKAVQHSNTCILMDWDSGNSLRYFADIEGMSWPDMDYLQRSRQEGRPLTAWEKMTLPERMDELTGKMGQKADYFIIIRKMSDLDLQPDLRRFLSAFPVIAEGHRFRVWDLR